MRFLKGHNLDQPAPRTSFVLGSRFRSSSSRPKSKIYDSPLIIPAFKFCERQWRKVTERDLGATMSSNLDLLKIITWNVWFDKFQFNRRFEEISRILKDLSADVICIQEATPAFVKLLIQEPWIRRDGYFISDITGDSVDPYGNLMLTKLPVMEFKMYQFPTSKMQRNVLVADLPVGSFGESYSTFRGKLTVGTTHLESMTSNTAIRKDQLKFATHVLKKNPNTLITGDFNFCGDWEENSLIDKSFVDVWPELIPAETDRGHTMEEFGPFPSWRPDRILLRSEKNIFEPVSISRVGMDEIDYSDLDIDLFGRVKTPSDHFGLVAQIKLNFPVPSKLKY